MRAKVIAIRVNSTFGLLRKTIRDFFRQAQRQFPVAEHLLRVHILGIARCLIILISSAAFCHSFFQT